MIVIILLEIPQEVHYMSFPKCRICLSFSLLTPRLDQLYFGLFWKFSASGGYLINDT